MFAKVFLVLKLIIFSLSLIVSCQSSAIECGISLNSAAFVFNGLRVGRYEFPWKVAVMKLKDDGDDSTYICGGVLVDAETIVTAAHCVRETNEEKLLERDLTIALGAHNMSKKVEAGRQFVSVKSIHIHNSWNPATLDFAGDIAVLKLAHPVLFNNFIRPVCLASQEISSMKNGSVAGWGIFDDGNMVSNLPRKIGIPIVSDRECFKKSPGLLQIIWDEAFCAGKERAGVCRGDSGSGFYVQENGRFYLRGIVSSSEAKPCGEVNFALYSDVIEYKNFIEKFMKSSASKDQENFEYHNVQAKCGGYGNLGYTCFIENLHVNESNFGIGNIATQHQSGKSDQDVKTIYVRESNLKYLPTFDDKFLAEKLPNAKQIIFNGVTNSVTLNFHPTKDKSSIPSNIESYFLANFGNKVEKLPNDLLTKSPQLKTFSAEGNKIEEIDSNFFAKNVKLKRLYIDRNRIKQLPANLLMNLEELTNFGANENEIVSIPRDFFHQNLRLERIYLHKNRITSLPDDLFKNNKNLRFIHIYNNKIKTLPPNLIANAPLLTEFYGYGNEIEEIPPNFTKNYLKLEKIRILN